MVLAQFIGGHGGCFNTQPPEGGWRRGCRGRGGTAVSTHSRLKAAGAVGQLDNLQLAGFNTQPPEGGWPDCPRRGLRGCAVSTHSRLKAAGKRGFEADELTIVSTHSRLKAAGFCFGGALFVCLVSTHSRLKAAGGRAGQGGFAAVCFNTQPPEGGWPCYISNFRSIGSFNTQPPEGGWKQFTAYLGLDPSFNTQPPEGGWFLMKHRFCPLKSFQHTAA